GDKGAEATAGLDLLRGGRRACGTDLAADGGVGGDIARRRGEVVYPDSIGPRDRRLGHRRFLGDLRRGAADEHGEEERERYGTIAWPHWCPPDVAHGAPRDRMRLDLSQRPPAPPVTWTMIPMTRSLRPRPCARRA